MTSDSTSALVPIFDLLDRWRHLPAYQLERRADIFFALYLPGIIEHALGVKVDPRVIPEFPIKREDSRKSKKVDYFLISEDRSRALLVELKTDMGSRREDQDDYLTLVRGTHPWRRHPAVGSGQASCIVGGYGPDASTFPAGSITPVTRTGTERRVPSP